MLNGSGARTGGGAASGGAVALDGPEGGGDSCGGSSGGPFAGSLTAGGLKERDRVRGLLAFEVADPAAPLTLTFAGGPKPIPVRVAR